MKRYRFELYFGAIFAVIFLVFWLWHSPLTGKLTPEEIDRYLAAIEKHCLLPPTEKPEMLARLRAWGVKDDGQPVYMLNLMRNYPQLQRYPGAPDFRGTPAESNKLYEDKAIPLLLKNCGYPLLIGRPQGKNIAGFESALDDWSEVLVVRYRDRRAFLELLADPAYGPIAPYKLMAVQLSLVPLNGEAVIPDLRLVVGGILLLVFLAVGWVRASRRTG